MRKVRHTNPYTGNVSGETQTNASDSTVITDGGETNVTTLADVSHRTVDTENCVQGTFVRGEIK